MKYLNMTNNNLNSLMATMPGSGYVLPFYGRSLSVNS